MWRAFILGTQSHSMTCTTTTDTIEPQPLDGTNCEASTAVQPLLLRGCCLGKEVRRCQVWQKLAREKQFQGRERGTVGDNPTWLIFKASTGLEKSLGPFPTARTLKID
jgi:hypothetical protein